MAVLSHHDAATGLLLVGHGTRSQTGRRQFLDLAEQLDAAFAPAAVQPAFLELAEPTIDDGLRRLVERGIQRLVIMPLLLFAAGHAKDDVPRTVSESLIRHGRGTLPRVQAQHLGCHPAMLNLSQLRLEERLKNETEAGPAGAARRADANEESGESVLLMVGRGSSDESATDEMRQFANLRAKQSGMLTEVAFLAMARPLLGEALAALAAKEPSSVVVQPHMLFHGDLAERLRLEVDAVRSGHPSTKWKVTSLLADEADCGGEGSHLLKDVIRDRWQEALSRVAAGSGDD